MKARYYQATDGAKQAFGWRDTMLGANCSFYMATDGKKRCLPVDFTQLDLPPSGPTGYADAACSQPLVQSLPSCIISGAYAYGYTTAMGPNGCSSLQMHIFAIGAKVSPPAVIYKMSGQQCIAAGPPPVGYDLYAAPEAPPSTFVEAVEKVEP